MVPTILEWIPKSASTHTYIHIYIYTYVCIHIPGTQMTFVLVGKGLVLGGWPSKIEVIWVPGICMSMLFFPRLRQSPCFDQPQTLARRDLKKSSPGPSWILAWLRGLRKTWGAGKNLKDECVIKEKTLKSTWIHHEVFTPSCSLMNLLRSSPNHGDPTAHWVWGCGHSQFLCAFFFFFFSGGWGGKRLSETNIRNLHFGQRNVSGQWMVLIWETST